MKSHTYYRFDTEYSADSVEVLRRQSSSTGLDCLVACGTYQVRVIDDCPTNNDEIDECSSNNDGSNNSSSGHNNAAYNRLGRLRIYTGKLAADSGSYDFKESVCIDTPAILDMRWAAESLLATAHAGGSVALWQFDQPESWGNDHHSLTKPPNPYSLWLPDGAVDGSESGENRLVLSLDWSSPMNGKVLFASSSDGRITVFDCTRASTGINDNAVVSNWHAHDYEAWVVASDVHSQGTILYSGGDDCWLKGWDRRQGFDTPVFQRRRPMGVTSIQSHPTREHWLATGGYDESLLLWDRRFMRVPVVDVAMGGGVWRIKWEPDDLQQCWRHANRQPSSRLLAACMHNGFHLVSITAEGNEELKTEGSGGISAVNDCSYMEHQSLAYGVDWIGHGVEGSQCDPLVASCSFYDHSLHVWSCCSNT